MFKKPVKVSAQNQLSGKDRKVLKSKISEYLDNECVDKILSTEDKIVCCKIQGSKMLIYNGEDYPLFVDGTGKNNFFPSLYVTMAYQPLIKCLIINEGVEAYIYNGANLMWPGVRSYEGLGEFSKDETVGIRNSKGEIIAIGAMGCGKKDLSDTSGVAVYILHYLGDKLWEMGSKNIPQVVVPLKVEAKKEEPKIQAQKEETKVEEKPKQKGQQPKKQQEKGKKQQPTKQAKKQQKQPEPKKQKTPQKSEPESQEDDDEFMNLVHSKDQPKGRVIKMQQKQSAKVAFIEDDKQQKNTKNKKKNQPASQQQKGKQKGGKNKKEESDEDVMEQQDQPKQKKNQKDNKKVDNKKKGKQDKKQKGKKRDESEQDENQKPKKEGTKQDGSDDEQKQEKGQQKSAINTKLMDEYFKETLFNVIKLTKIEQELPIDSGRFFMDFMLLARPEGVKLQIKETSYKKIGKFFEEMAKKKVLEYKHPKDKKAQGAQITKIFWQNEQLKNHVPTIKKLGSKEEEQKVETYSKAKLKLSKGVTLETVYKPSQELFNEVLKKPLNLMPAEGEKQVTDKQEVEFVTEKELREKIERYINKIIDAPKEKKEQKDKQVKKVEKTILIDYHKHAFLKELLKKEIEEYEQNKEKEEVLRAEEGSDDEDGDKKKKKGKKGATKELLRVERHYLAEKLMKKASPYFHVFDQQNGLDIFKQGTFKGIQIVAEKVSNKNVTRVSGLELFITPKTEADDQINGFAHTLQLKFACSVNIHNLPGKNAGKEIIIHGTFLDQLQEMFTEEYELPNKFISTLNKLDKKKKN